MVNIIDEAVDVDIVVENPLYQQIIPGGANTALNTGVGNNMYYLPQGGLSPQGSPDYYAGVVPTDGIFKNLTVLLSTPPTPGQWTFTLMRNGQGTGGAWVATGLTVTLSGSTQLITTDPSINERFYPGDRVTLRIHVDAGGGPTVYPKWSLVFSADNPLENIMLGSVGSVSNSALNYSHISGQNQWRAGLWNHPLPINAIAKKLYVSLSTAPTQGSWAFTLMRAGATTPVSCTIGTGATTGNSGATNQAFTKGEYCNGIQSSPTGTPTAVTYVNYGVVYELPAAGYSVVYGSCAGLISADTFAPLSPASANTTENIVSHLMRACSVSSLYVYGGNPGTGNQWMYTILNNGAFTPVVAIINPGSSTANSGSTSALFAANQTCSIMIDAVGSPAGMYTEYGCLLTV